MLYRTTVNYNPALSPLHSFFSHLFFFVSPLSRKRGVVSMLPLWAHVVSVFAKLFVPEHICKHNKVTKHELLNLQLLFTLVILLAWGGRYVLREAGEPLGYLLLDFTLNLSQACFNSREVQQKWPLQAHLCIPHCEFQPPLYRCCTVTMLHQLPANLLQPADSWFTSNNKEWTKCPIIKNRTTSWNGFCYTPLLC